jgi:hypothetical protein
MPSSETLRRLALARIDVSEKRIVFIIRVTIVFLRSVLRLLVTVKVVPSPPILATLMMEAIRSCERRFLQRTTRRNIPEDDILHSHHRENLKSYKFRLIYRLILIIYTYIRVIMIFRPTNALCSGSMLVISVLLTKPSSRNVKSEIFCTMRPNAQFCSQSHQKVTCCLRWIACTENTSLDTRGWGGWNGLDTN